MTIDSKDKLIEISAKVFEIMDRVKAADVNIKRLKLDLEDIHITLHFKDGNNE